MDHVSLPCPGFEGFEKRLDIEFEPVTKCNSSDDFIPKHGLRSIPRNELDAILSSAECTIVSQLRNNFFDSYVLSESSLFIYPNRVVVKTCGTTKLLECISLLISSASKIHMKPRRCRYSRGTFLFPEAQPDIHKSFSLEAKYLDKYFGHLGSGGKAYIMGDALKFPNWHIYVADSLENTQKKCDSIYTLEMCMTQLDKQKASQFFQSSGVGSAKQVTKLSGIADLLPDSDIDDFLFEPCGYSMNGIEGSAHSTIHITPEDGFSYASFETMGYTGSEINLSGLIDKVLSVFRPSSFSMALHIDGSVSARGSWGGPLLSIPGYYCDGTSRQVLPLESCIVFHTFKKNDTFDPNRCLAPLSLIEDVSPEPPVSTLKEKMRTLSMKYLETSSFIPESAHDFGENVATLVSTINPSIIGKSEKEIDSYMKKYISSSELEDPFYVMDMASVLQLWKTWTSAMPRVKPFYAVKCNPDPVLLSLLASLGTGFDVASQSELDRVLPMGVSPSQIIFANPCKLPSHMDNASKEGVRLTTFDSEMELIKFKKYYPNVQAVLRLRADDRGARCPLGVKYGAEYEDCEGLLMASKRLGINVVGIAFHVGSGAADPGSYADGIYSARTLFDTATKLGMPPMWLLDIGGGFTSKGGNGVSFSNAATAINESLDKYFPVDMGVSVIGEPGRFFAEAPFTLATHVFGSRVRRRSSVVKPEYWINDGLYGSMNCLLYDHAELTVRPLKRMEGSELPNVSNHAPNALFQSTVFGPTCDGLDTVLRDVWLPKLECGDWLVFPRMGAYTQAAGSSFNGFDTSKISTLYVFSTGAETRTESYSTDGYSSSDSGDETAFNNNLGSSSGFSAEGSGMSSSDDDGF